MFKAFVLSTKSCLQLFWFSNDLEYWFLLLKHPNQLLFSAKSSTHNLLEVAMPKIVELGNFWAWFNLFIYFKNLPFENIL